MIKSLSRTPLVEFRLRLESSTTCPSRSAAASQPLSWASVPFSTFNCEDPLTASVPPLAMVRPQGLVTLSTAYAPRSLAGFVSRQQRSWDSLSGAFPSHKVSRAFPPSRTHIPFLLRFLPPPKRRAGPVGRGSWALALARVPGDRRGVSTSTTGCSHELYPFRVLQQKP